MKKAIAAACLALCLPLFMASLPSKSSNPTPTTSQATPPPPPPVVVATFLDFTPGQATEFQALLGQFLGTLQVLKAQVNAREQVLQQLLSAPSPNPPLIGVVVLQIHALEQQQVQAVQSFQQAFVSLLAPDQLQKVQAVAQAAQLGPVVGAFQSLYLIPPEPAASSPNPGASPKP